MSDIKQREPGLARKYSGEHRQRGSLRIVADVHGAAEALAKEAAHPEPLLVLGDLINFVDYRTNEGIVADICGIDFVAELVRLRTIGDTAAAKDYWFRFADGREQELRDRTDAAVRRQYADVGIALADADAYVMYGNADRPEILIESLPPGARFVDGERLELAGWTVGFVGGGLRLEGGIPVPGEVTEDELAQKLSSLGDVDVLCTHVPPAIVPLQQDVVGGRQKGSEAVLDYVRAHQPPFHYFGDIHQPQATTWRVGKTRCVNAGYFRATSRAVLHGPSAA